MPRELRSWQSRVLAAVAAMPLAREATFGGRAALSVAYLHHRRSEDLDFFLQREPTAEDLVPLASVARGLGFRAETRPLAVRQALVLLKGGTEVGHIDVAFYPYIPWTARSGGKASASIP